MHHGLLWMKDIRACFKGDYQRLANALPTSFLKRPWFKTEALPYCRKKLNVKVERQLLFWNSPSLR
jgi:hypothetical protein